MKRKRLLRACWTLFLFTLGLVTVIGVMMLAEQHKTQPEDDVLMRVKDRPVLETPEQIYMARKTGYATFHIGKDYYVVENLPEEYIKYSEWYVRMP